MTLRAPLETFGGAGLARLGEGQDGRGRGAAADHPEHKGPPTYVAEFGAGAAGANSSLAHGRRLSSCNCCEWAALLWFWPPRRPRPPRALRYRLRTRRRPSRRAPPAGTVAPISDSGAMEDGIQVVAWMLESVYC